MAKFIINATFDITCPWCYIGHIRLHRAITQHKSLSKNRNDSFTINLVPFYLKPSATPAKPPFFPVPTQSRKELREETYGSAQAQQIVRNIQAAADDDGLRLKFGGQTGATRNGHRLVHHASKVMGPEGGERILDALFKAYHEREVDITRLDVLTDIGYEHGVSERREDVESFLLSGDEGEEVDALVGEAKLRLRSGVPSFEVSVEGRDGQGETVGGAITTSAWLQLFARLGESG